MKVTLYVCTGLTQGGVHATTVRRIVHQGQRKCFFCPQPVREVEVEIPEENE